MIESYQAGSEELLRSMDIIARIAILGWFQKIDLDVSLLIMSH